MSEYSTFEECRRAALDRIGEDPTDTTGDFYAAAGREVVRAGREVYNRHPWLFTRQDPPGVLALVPAYTTGLLTVTPDVTAVTFSPAPGAGLGSFAGRKVVVEGWPEFYRIVTHSAGDAAAVLDVAWQGPALEAGFVAYQDEYTIAADVRYFVSAFYRARDGAAIRVVSEDLLRAEYPEPARAADLPLQVARIGETKIRFSHYVRAGMRVEYPYHTIGPDVDTGPLLIPVNHRQVLADGACYFLHEMKNDTRAAAAGIVYGSHLDQMLADDDRKRHALTEPPHRNPYR